MPSMVIHLAVGNEYAKKFKIDDFKEFRNGILTPDILGMKSKADKIKAHYSDLPLEGASKYQSCYDKVNLLNYLKANQVQTDYDKGYFLHLITDYYFFGYQILQKPNFEQMLLEELYPDYEKIAAEIKQKYNVDDSDTPWFELYQTGKPTILNMKDVYDLIYVCSQVDLKTIEKQVRENQNNWREVLIKQFNSVLKNKDK